MRKVLLFISAGISALFGVFHCLFPQFFDWQQNIPNHIPNVKDILFTLNWICAYMLFVMAAIAILIAIRNKNSTIVERFTMLTFAGFFILRIVLGPIYFGFTMSEFVVWGLCAIAAMGFIVHSFLTNK